MPPSSSSPNMTSTQTVSNDTATAPQKMATPNTASSQRAHPHLCVKQGHCRDRKQCFEHLNDMYQMIKNVPNYLTQLKTTECNTLQEGDILFLQANLENGRNSCGKEGTCCHCDYIRSIDPSTQEFKRLLKRVRDFWKKRKSEQQRSAEGRKHLNVLHGRPGLEHAAGGIFNSNLSIANALANSGMYGNQAQAPGHDLQQLMQLQNQGLNLGNLLNQNMNDAQFSSQQQQQLHAQQVLQAAQQYQHLQQQQEYLQRLQATSTQQRQHQQSRGLPNAQNLNNALLMQQQLPENRPLDATALHHQQVVVELVAKENIQLKQELLSMNSVVSQLQGHIRKLESVIQSQGLTKPKLPSPLVSAVAQTTELQGALQQMDHQQQALRNLQQSSQGAFQHRNTTVPSAAAMLGASASQASIVSAIQKQMLMGQGMTKTEPNFAGHTSVIDSRKRASIPSQTNTNNKVHVIETKAEPNAISLQTNLLKK